MFVSILLALSLPFSLCPRLLQEVYCRKYCSVCTVFPRQEIEVTCCASKNLYNCGIYLCRPAFFNQDQVSPFKELDHFLKNSEDDQSWPSKVAQLVIKQVATVFQSYFAAIKADNNNPKKFLGKSKLPKSKHTEKGRNLVIYNYQAISRTWLKKGVINPSRLNLKNPTNLTFDGKLVKRLVVSPVRFTPYEA